MGTLQAQARRWGRVVAVALGLCLLAPGSSAAQGQGDDQPAWVEDLGVVSANVVAGGLTAALTAAIRGHDVSDAFLKGAAGGAVWFAGKRVTVESFDGAGFLGREVGALGSSIVANGGAGRGWLEEVWLPAGPVWIQVRRDADRRVRVNAADIAVALWGASHSEIRLDWRRSLSNGTLLFRADRHTILYDSSPALGLAIGGVVLMGVSRLDEELVRAHEMVHVIQQDFLLHTWGRPLEAWAWDRTLGWKVPVDMGLSSLVLVSKFLRSLGESEADVLEFR